jgi:hypothetical protein
MWGRLLTCAPIANRRKPGGLATRAQDDILPHYLVFGLGGFTNWTALAFSSSSRRSTRW